MDNDFALDKILLDLKDENVSDTLGRFAQTIYFTQKEKIPIICNKLVPRLPGRIKSLNAYAHFIHFLACGSQKYQYKSEFASELLDKVFMKPVLLDFIYRKIPIFAVLRMCIELGTFDIEDIKVRVLKNFQLRSRYSLIMALFFLPEIRDAQCQKFLANFLTANVQGTSLIGNSLFLELNMDNLVADDYALLKSFIKTGCQHNEFALCCKNDDMNRLQDLSMMSNFDLNMRISNNFFEHCFFCHANPPLISYAAAYGSIKCFKFLLLNNADLNICDDDNFYPEHFAIVGGNVEIIHLIEQRRFDETNTLQIASLFYYDAVFEWLLNTRKINVLSAASTLYSVVHTCAIANNFHAMSLVLSLGADINARGNDTLTALMLAACFGSYDTVKILVTNSKINLSISNRHKQTALQICLCLFERFKDN